MQVEIRVVLTDEDMEAGLTAQAAVEKAFPTQQTATALEWPKIKLPDSMVQATADEDRVETTLAESPATETATFEHGTVDDLEEEIDTGDSTPPPQISNDAELALDAAGIPWLAELHSGNKKKYASGPDQGRWQWKRGSDPETREARARELAGLVGPKPVGGPAAGGSNFEEAAAPANTIVPPGTGADVESMTPPGVVAPPGLGQPPGVNQGATDPVEQPTGVIPTDWPDFCKAIKASGRTFADVDPFLAQFGMETISELGNNQTARDEIAAMLGLVTQS